MIGLIASTTPYLSITAIRRVQVEYASRPLPLLQNNQAAFLPDVALWTPSVSPNLAFIRTLAERPA
jgi:hypothetical protein